MGDGKAVRFNDAELTLKQLFESIKGAFVWRLMWGGDVRAAIASPGTLQGIQAETLQANVIISKE